MTKDTTITADDISIGTLTATRITRTSHSEQWIVEGSTDTRFTCHLFLFFPTDWDEEIQGTVILSARDTWSESGIAALLKALDKRITQIQWGEADISLQVFEGKLVDGPVQGPGYSRWKLPEDRLNPNELSDDPVEAGKLYGLADAWSDAWPDEYDDEDVQQNGGGDNA